MSAKKAISLFYMTFPSKKEARQFARLLLEKNLAACTNLLPKMESSYKWKGEIEVAKECVLLIKAPSENFSKIEAQMKEHHSYDTPCLLQWKLENISKDYLDWMLK